LAGLLCSVLSADPHRDEREDRDGYDAHTSSILRRLTMPDDPTCEMNFHLGG
jgi:hypothetical protein